MRQKYFAFYWTLPVPWVGFTSLPADVDAAAEVSRTIRYQRDRVRRHVRDVGGTLLPQDEVVRLELRPDRGSAEVAEDFARLLHRAEDERAMVAIMDFAGDTNWRRHGALVRHYEHPCCDRITLCQDEVHPDGINPYAHFQKWREQTEANTAGKSDHRVRILAALGQAEGESVASQVRFLNASGLRTHSGKMWTSDNLRKFLRVEPASR
ncbi:hypothetical protein [Paenirhodobacter populi]|uniref:Recombinase domain-containing protein n=2 Tax=Paenirhodobacter populi TaxID=2306993 RepID=A0A443JGA6_9RHOB|nr:hypothetical protein [Sinirhodobacter populi]RWR19577.1 hypothetical protein D2T30_13790 [Sinirhodobacter populi]